VVRRGARERQKFNFHVEFVHIDADPDQTYAIGVVIDPDIKNTGETGFPT
jgi:hypothetical protein